MTNAEIGERIRKARRSRKMSQQKLADKMAHYTPTTAMTISRWERGENVPSTKSLYALCKAMNVTADYVLGLSSSDVLLKYAKIERIVNG